MDSVRRAVSAFVVQLMNKIGYDEKIIQERTDHFSKIGEIQCSPFTTVIVGGSKGEGIANILEGDYDLLYVINDVLCCENGTYNHELHDQPWIFTGIKGPLCSAGYLIQVLSKPGPSSFLEMCLIRLEDGQCMFSSSLFLECFEDVARQIDSYCQMFNKNLYDGMTSQIEPHAGPSIPSSWEKEGVQGSIDKVYSIRCHCPSVLHEWFIRRRKYGWPSLELRVEVLRLGANLCPVGYRTDKLCDIEWRLCFNLGEKKLVHSWNDVQKKLYILLKMLLKEKIKPEDKELSSYVIKNIVFWLSEMYPQEAFTSNSLMQLVRKALKMLKQSIEMNLLPYYMIPKRNLLKNLKQERKQTLISRISSILADPFIVFHCRKLEFGAKLFEKKLLDAWQVERDSCERLVFKQEINDKHLGEESYDGPPELVDRLMETKFALKESIEAKEKELEAVVTKLAVTDIKLFQVL